MIAVYKRELKSFFQTMIGNIFLAFLIGFVGFYFTMYNLNYGYNFFSYALSSATLILVFVIPILTMRSFAEERKNKTDQLLLTAPIKVTSIVLGKYLAMVTLFLMACLVFCVCPLIIKTMGTAHFRIDYLAILVFFLIGCFFIALGMYVSALTESQIIAAVSTIGIMLVFFFMSAFLGLLPQSASGNLIDLLIIIALMCLLIQNQIHSWLVTGAVAGLVLLVIFTWYFIDNTAFENMLVTFLTHFQFLDTLSQIADSYVLKLSDLVLLLSTGGLFVFLTIQSIEKRRWS